jgi:hypothetical protein
MHDVFENLKGLIVRQIPKRETLPEFQVDPEHACVHVRFIGTLTIAQIQRYATALRQYPGFCEDWSEIVDLRGVDEITMSADDTIALADDVDPFSLSSRRAFVVANELQFHRARMQQVLRSPSKSIGIFETVAEAERWVRLPVSRKSSPSAQVLPFPLRHQT